jgi:hypothetical protein
MWLKQTIIKKRLLIINFSYNFNRKLKAGERKTGSSEGLFFMPFDNKSSIPEVGISNVKVLAD